MNTPEPNERVSVTRGVAARAPGGYPLVGHTPHLVREPLSTLTHWGRTDAGICSLRLPRQQFHLVTDPAAVRTIANRTLRLVTATVCRRRRLSTDGSLSVTVGPKLAFDGRVRLLADPVE